MVREVLVVLYPGVRRWCLMSSCWRLRIGRRMRRRSCEEDTALKAFFFSREEEERDGMKSKRKWTACERGAKRKKGERESPKKKKRTTRRGSRNKKSKAVSPFIDGRPRGDDESMHVLIIESERNTHTRAQRSTVHPMSCLRARPKNWLSDCTIRSSGSPIFTFVFATIPAVQGKII